jgi:hypothetical protein
MKSKILVAAFALIAGFQGAYAADDSAPTDTLVLSVAPTSGEQLEQQRGTFTVINLLPLVKLDVFSQTTGTIVFIQSPIIFPKNSFSFPRAKN